MENISLEHILIQSRITILDLLQDRGYETAPFRKMIGPELVKLVTSPETLRMTLERKPDANPNFTKEKCIVEYEFSPIISRMKTGEYVRKMLGKPPDNESKLGKATKLYNIDPVTTEVIVLYIGKDTSDDKESPYDKAAYLAWSEHKCKIQFFMIHRLVCNPMKHILQPKFEILPPDEHDSLKKEWYMNHKTQLPIIRFHSDMAARCLGLVPMDIVKITCPSPTGGTYVKYRVCLP
jgi:DNA-directed RNA polymerase subunit H (RpoH/RPB5)